MIEASKDFVLCREEEDQVNAAVAVALILPPFLLLFFVLSRRPPQHIEHLREPMRVQHSQALFQPLSSLPLPPSLQGEKATKERSCDCGPRRAVEKLDQGAVKIAQQCTILASSSSSSSSSFRPLVDDGG